MDTELMPEVRQPTDIGRLHQRIDEVLTKISEVDHKVTAIASVCGPCQERLGSLESAIDGNGKCGIKERLAAVETGKTDTLSVRSVTILIGSIGALVATVLGALAAMVARNATIIDQVKP